MSAVITEDIRDNGTIEFTDGDWVMTVDPPNDEWGRHRSGGILWSCRGRQRWRDALAFQNLLAAAVARCRILDTQHQCAYPR